MVLENTPEVLQDFLADHYTTWADFETDVATTSASQLLWAKQCIINEQKLQKMSTSYKCLVAARSQLLHPK